MLHRAREESATLVANAREAAAARDAALTADLEALAHELETTIADERHRQEEALKEAAQKEALRFDETGPEQLEALAGYVVERVIGVEP
jgi:hypothetical protein